MISFVVPAYNEERHIGRTLAALAGAGQECGDPFEIIVVDDASTDRTARIAAEHGARVVEVAHRQIAPTRNAGARAAVGDELIFVDADTIVTSEVVRAAAEALRRGAVGGGCAVRFDGKVPLYSRLALPMLLWGLRLGRIAAGCFLFCSRAAFEAVGGFDEALYGAEEIAISRALGRQGEFVILRESVTTSGRKVRAFSAWELSRAMGRLASNGPRAFRTRRGMEIWYEARREDPALIEIDETRPTKETTP